jgi:glycosyltransferase involved in cell wall biosynthesis
MKNLKVVHLIDGLTLGGAEMMLYKLVSRQNGASMRHVVISFMDKGEVAALIRASGVPLHSLGLARGTVSLRAFFQLRQLLITERPDVVMTWSATANLIGTIVAKLSGSPKVVWNIRRSGSSPGEYSRLTALAIHLCARHSRAMDLIIANAEEGRRAYEAMGYRPKEWCIIPNGFDLIVFHPDLDARASLRRELKLSEEVPIIGIVGRYTPEKDHATFVKAAGRLHAVRPEVHFLMVGAGLEPDNQALREIAPRLFTTSVVHLLGIRHDIPRLLAALDLFTLTSLGEGFPNVVGEAMACGVPCVVAATAGNAPAIVGDTGVVVSPRDAQILAEAWERLLNYSMAERQALGQAARERIQEFYSLDAVVRQYEGLFFSMVAA